MTLVDWTAEWRARSTRTGPLTDTEWHEVRDSLAATYRLARLRQPEDIIRTRSPREAIALAAERQIRYSAADRVNEAIRMAERDHLQRAGYRGTIADEVDRGVLDPRAWGNDLHPDMTRSPGAGNFRIGAAAEAAWLLNQPEAAALPKASTRALRAVVGRSVAGPARYLDDRVYVSDLPTIYRTDQSGLPHWEDGPALIWADATSLSFWHGTRVPNDFFTWSPEQALGCGIFQGE